MANPKASVENAGEATTCRKGDDSSKACANPLRVPRVASMLD